MSEINAYTLLVEDASLSASLEILVEQLTMLQKGIEDNVEAKRLAFPRLFFLSEREYIDFLHASANDLPLDQFISQIFPGVKTVHIEKSKGEELPTQINDISLMREE